MKAEAASQKGKRDINQDLILEYSAMDGSYLFAVIDGMGGYEGGEIAAKIIRDNIETYLSTVRTIDAFHLQKAINKSNLAIRQRKTTMSDKMGATLGGIFSHGSSVTYFWIGDVKVYHFRHNHLIFESTPHSLVSQLIQGGSITEPKKLSRYKHIVTRSIHGEIKSGQMEIAGNNFDRNSDLLIVCSDGVHDLFDGIQLEVILHRTGSPAEIKVELLSICERDAIDNYTFGIVS